jgi:hypothetical protein
MTVRSAANAIVTLLEFDLFSGLTTADLHIMVSLRTGASWSVSG